MNTSFLISLIMVASLTVFLPNLNETDAYCEDQYSRPGKPDYVHEPLVSGRVVLTKSVFREGNMLVLALAECESSDLNPWGWYYMHADVDADYGGSPDSAADYFDSSKSIWDFAASSGECSDDLSYQMAIMRGSSEIRGFVCMPPVSCISRWQDHDVYGMESLSSGSDPPSDDE